MNTVFNFKRFWHTLQQEFCLAAKPLMIFALLLVGIGILLILSLMANLDAIALLLWSALIPVSLFGVWHFSAKVVKNIATDKGFVAFTLLPASPLEKFCSRLIVYHFVPILLWILLSMIIIHIPPVYSVYFEHYPGRNYGLYVAFLTVLIWFAAINVFWATVFRRFGFAVSALVTTASIVLISISIENANLMFLDPIARYIYRNTVNVYIVDSIATVVFCTIVYCLSFWMYQRKQLNVKLFRIR